MYLYTIKNDNLIHIKMDIILNGVKYARRYFQNAIRTQ